MREIRTPKIGDRVALPKHAGVFLIKAVDNVNETVDADLTTKIGWIEKSVPWTMLTFLDLEGERRA
jgi:hypothetical protein